MSEKITPINLAFWAGRLARQLNVNDKMTAEKIVKTIDKSYEKESAQALKKRIIGLLNGNGGNKEIIKLLS